MGLINFGHVSDELVEIIRQRFLKERYEGNEDSYDPADIEQVKNEAWMIKRFVILAYKVTTKDI